MKLKGYLLAAVAAATYGTNPAFAVPLYTEGMNPARPLAEDKSQGDDAAWCAWCAYGDIVAYAV